MLLAVPRGRRAFADRAGWPTRPHPPPSRESPARSGLAPSSCRFRVPCTAIEFSWPTSPGRSRSVDLPVGRLPHERRRIAERTRQDKGGSRGEGRKKERKKEAMCRCASAFHLSYLRVVLQLLDPLLELVGVARLILNAKHPSRNAIRAAHARRFCPLKPGADERRVRLHHIQKRGQVGGGIGVHCGLSRLHMDGWVGEHEAGPGSTHALQSADVSGRFPSPLYL